MRLYICTLAMVTAAAGCKGGGSGGRSTIPQAAVAELNEARAEQTLTRLAPNFFLTCGGRGRNGELLATAETIHWAPPHRLDIDSAMPMHVPRAGHTATALSTGEVLVAGGSQSPVLELFIPGAAPTDIGDFVLLVDELQQPRTHHQAVLLANGRVFVIGGYLAGDDSVVASTEIYDPAAAPGNRVTQGSSLAEGRADATATLLADGRVLVAGGLGSSGLTLATVEIYAFGVDGAQTTLGSFLRISD